MPRYIDADKLWNDRPQVTPEKSMDYKAGFSECMWAFSKLIREQIDNSTADVVPKSECEKLVQVGTRLGQENETLKDNNEHLAVMLEETKIELDAMRGAANSLKMHYEKAEAEVRRLRGILLQFTDIVHKWGAKNNIDTSEISLVPILQQEADSIIKKANQELVSEIFAEIDDIFLMFKPQYFVDAPHLNYKRLTDLFAELKKKYTEDTK